MKIPSLLLCTTILWLYIVKADAKNNQKNKIDKEQTQQTVKWSVKFEHEQLNMTLAQTQNISFSITNIEPLWGNEFKIRLSNDNGEVASLESVKTVTNITNGETIVKGNFTINALNLGYTNMHVELQRISQLNSYESEISQQLMIIIVTRSTTMLDIIFNICIACFITAIYINFGAVVDLVALKEIILCPIGPAIGLFCQYFIMPVLSFLIGYILFYDMIEIRLGLFFLGVSPAGGMSNLFAVLLNGNLSLSITMTAISNLAAFGMMPLWIFTLGALIFRDGNFIIPYKSIASISCTLVIPIALGIMLQKYAPDVTKKISKVLKPISLILIISLAIIACFLNSYMFKLFSLKILFGSCMLPWLGYIFGWVIATVLCQPTKDAITIAIETGIQNIGIAIFMLNFTLPQPQADMTSVVPIAVSLVTPLPLLLIYFFKLCFSRKSRKSVEDESHAKDVKDFELIAIMEGGAGKENTKYPQ